MNTGGLKRLFDISVSLMGLIICSPVLVIVSILVATLVGRPVLFKQARPGRKGKIFTIYKFRTMKDSFDDRGELLPDKKRMTKFGGFLRETSLDEIPELINVLKGDMSIVGPRPLLVRYLDRYTPEQARRHDVRPGITGWAQVNGRNAISWEEKFQYDVWYVDNLSFLLDLKIIINTIGVIFDRKKVYQSDGEFMEEFVGKGNGRGGV